MNDRPERERIDYSPDRPPRHRRALVRRWLFIVLVLVVIIPALALGVGALRLHRMERDLADMDARYRRVERGMTAAEVRAAMGSVGTPHPAPWFAAWDDDVLNEGEAKRVVSALRYVAPRPMFDVAFEFQFDRDGRVVGKHRYD